MPSSTPIGILRRWLTSQRNATILVAIAVAVPTVAALQHRVGGQVGGFLLLLTLAVGVPTAYDEYWPRYDRTWRAVAWTVGACAVATVEFLVVYHLGASVVGLFPTHAAVAAFLVTDLGTLLLLANWPGRS